MLLLVLRGTGRGMGGGTIPWGGEGGGARNVQRAPIYIYNIRNASKTADSPYSTGAFHFPDFSSPSTVTVSRGRFEEC